MGKYYVSVQILDSANWVSDDRPTLDAEWLAELEEDEEAYEQAYKHVKGSPFLLTAGSNDPSLFLTYQDLLIGGLGMTAHSTVDDTLNLRVGDESYAEDGRRINPMALFQITVHARDVFDNPYSGSYFDIIDSPPGDVVKIDFVNHDYECLSGSDFSRIARYCRYFSYS